jgi:hypothetical protein
MAFLSFPSSQYVRRSGGRLLCALGLLAASSLLAQTPNVEYRVKSAYMFNFAKFVTWPSSAFASPEAPIVIGIIGKDPFGSEIDETIAGKVIEKRPLKVKRLAENDSPEGCHILFVGELDRKRVSQILQQASRLSILTVGEKEDFPDLGGMIRFFQHEKNIRFEIYLDAVEAAGLKISSKLLQVAIVKAKTRK